MNLALVNYSGWCAIKPNQIVMAKLSPIRNLEEEARRQLHKNVESNIEQVLVATPDKAPTIRPPVSHHKNYTS